MNNLKNCNICPRKCNINRYTTKGFCSSKNKIKIARAALHYWEEPCLSGTKGSGTVFFSGCNLKCVYCQNKKISTNNYGKEISIKRLSQIFIELQEKGANNINLVTPTHYTYQIKKALLIAKKNGLNIPIVYNTGSYENKETLKELEGLIDIYLPDLKYYNDIYAKKYSNVNNYFKYASLAIKEMYRQVGKNKFNKDGMLIRGIIVRHLLLPRLENDSKKILKYLYNEYKDNIYISIMNQYTPLEYVKLYPEINRKVTNKEYNRIINYAIDLGIENGFIQDKETQKESFIPEFNNTGV